MAVTNATEKTRLSRHHLGKFLFAQCAELMNSSMNRGLAPSLTAADPSRTITLSVNSQGYTSPPTGAYSTPSIIQQWMPRNGRVATSSTTVLVDLFMLCTFISDSLARSVSASIPLFRVVFLFP
ncbi:uncharacterized protein EV420DRAFT_384602 [Desarmillaria tabescens]|uniref:Uncharacterized protein n=1 Tax=Armillaria tabescens TaxID=1929756 RepID=A0AA39KBN7_ARMTA|nr:uncharacterized protein EV420DRAFT_384602 [Desarmillaria tabescens]KAK0458196.1 hypothetical protein EV420DRAFT_384602 [Desarmillaria tabescens]